MKKSDNNVSDPFANGILAEKSRRGELPDYSYKSSGLPKLGNKPVFGWSPSFEFFKMREQKEKAEKEKAKKAKAKKAKK